MIWRRFWIAAVLFASLLALTSAALAQTLKPVVANMSASATNTPGISDTLAPGATSTLPPISTASANSTATNTTAIPATLYTDPNGAYSVPIPNAWKIQKKAQYLAISDSTAAFEIDILVVGSTDLEEAARVGWQIVAPTFEPVIAVRTKHTPANGFEQTLYMRYAPDAAQKVYLGVAQLYKGVSLVLLERATVSAFVAVLNQFNALVSRMQPLAVPTAVVTAPPTRSATTVSDPSATPVASTSGGTSGTYTDPVGLFTVTIPDGWTAESKGSYAQFFDASKKFEIYILTIPSSDLEAATTQAWKIVYPDLTLTKIATRTSTSFNGFEKVLGVTYTTGDGDGSTIYAGFALLFKGTTFVVLVKADMSTYIEHITDFAKFLVSLQPLAALPNSSTAAPTTPAPAGPSGDVGLYVDPAGLFNVPIPANWEATPKDHSVQLSAPDKASTIDILTVKTSDLAGAIGQAWKLVDPNFKLPPTTRTQPKPGNGFEKALVISYKSANAMTIYVGVAQLSKGIAYVMLERIEVDSYLLLYKQIRSIVEGLQPLGATTTAATPAPTTSGKATPAPTRVSGTPQPSNGNAADVYTDPAGLFSIPIPAGWTVTKKVGYAQISDPDKKIEIDVLTVKDSDLEAAIAKGWKIVNPKFNLAQARKIVPTAQTNGFEDSVILAYRSDDPKLAYEGLAELFKGTSYVLLIKGEIATFQKRAGQFVAIVNGFKALGAP